MADERKEIIKNCMNLTNIDGKTKGEVIYDLTKEFLHVDGANPLKFNNEALIHAITLYNTLLNKGVILEHSR